MSVNLLTSYYTTANSSVLTTAELLVSSVGTPTTFAGGSTINNSSGWYEVGLGGSNTTFYGSIQNPTGLGALLDSSALQGNALQTGCYSGSMQFSLSQASTAMSGSMVLRFFKYNAQYETYTSIGSITNNSVNINSTSAITVTWNSTQFSSVSFDFDEYLYVDIWFNVVTNTMTTGGQFQIIIPNSSTQGIAAEYFATPGYVQALSPHELAVDNYTRANQSGWGTAFDHINSWTARDATATYSIVSNQGKILQNSTSVDELNTLYTFAANVAYEIYGQCTTSNATSHPGLCVNYQSAGNFIKCEISTSGVNVIRYISNSQTTLKSDASIKVTASNTTYNFRFRWEVGGAYFFKVWTGTNAEPAAWNCDGVVDTTYNSGAVGVYLAPRGSTSDTCLWSQYYVSYSTLNENTIINGLTLSDSNSTFTIADASEVYTLSSSSETQAWAVTSVPQDAVSEQESVTFVLAETISADTLTQADAGSATVIQRQTDTLSAPTDSQAWVEKFVPTDALSSAEASLFALAETINADVASTSDSLLPFVIPNIVDNLTESEASHYAIAESIAETTLNESETVLLGLSDVFPSDSLNNSENSSYAQNKAFPSDALSMSELDHSDEYFSVEEDASATDSVIEVILDSPVSDSVTLNEVRVFVLAETITPDSASSAETTLIITTQTAADTAGSTDDSIAFGQPGVIFPDQLTINEQIDFYEVHPLVDVGLISSDQLDSDTNFTDHLHINENLQIGYASSLLDARSVLYSNTIADGPSAYYQLNEDTFGGIFQRDGSDQPNNASIPILYGATLQYTWARIEPDEEDYQFAMIDDDMLPWVNQDKKIILRVFVASTPFYNSEHNNNTAGQATPQWVFDAGAASITGHDGAVYPVYWNATFIEKYTNFVKALANYYDENSAIAGIVISCGVNGTTALEASGDTTGSTIATWTPVGYTPAQWVAAVLNITQIYQTAFQHTPLILSVNDGVIAPDAVYNIHQFISLAVAQGVWLMDENVYINEQHNDPNWNIVPLVTVPQHSIASGLTPDTLDGQLTLSINYQADYAAIWASDITASTNAILTKYYNLAQTKGLNDSATSNFKMDIFGGVYPTSHISTGDYLNGAQQFDGLTGYGYISRLAQANIDAWTIKCTVFPTILPMEEAIAFGVGNDGSTGYGGYAIGVSGGSSGGVGAKFCAHLPGIGWLDSGYSFPQVGQWYSLFVTWDGVTLRFYANGVECPNTYTISANVPSLAMTIGAQWDGMTRTPKRFFIGSIDECAVYPFALDANRILVLSDIEYGMNELLSGSGSFFTVTEQLSINDDSSTTNDVFFAAESLTLAEVFAFSTASSNVKGYATLANDQFNRIVTSGLGTATDGNIWQVKTGSSTLSVDGSVGSVTGDTSTNILFLGTPASLQDVSVMFQASRTGGTFGVIAFGVDANNYYSLRYTSTLQVYKTVSGVSTALGSAAAFMLSAGTWYHVHFVVNEGVLHGNIWADGSSEPIEWMVTAADTSLSSGRAGIYINNSSSDTVISVDNLFAIDDILSDYVFLQESYNFTSILPPLIDQLSDLADVPSSTINVFWNDDTLSTSDTITLNGEATTRDFLLFGASTQMWNVNAIPIEQLNEVETISTPVIISIPADEAPQLSDLIIPYVALVPTDMLFPAEAFNEACSVNLTDAPTLIDASTITQLRTIVDSDPSIRYITRAFGGTIKRSFATPLIASDKIVPADNPEEQNTLSTFDSISHGPAYLLTENINLVESLLVSFAESIPADVLVAPTDVVNPTVNPVPTDLLAAQEANLFLGSEISPPDIGTLDDNVTSEVIQFSEDDTSETENYVTDGPYLLQDDGVTVNESIIVTTGYVPENVTPQTEIDVTFWSVTFPDDTGIVSSDSVTPGNNPVLQDTIVSSDSISQSVSSFPLADTPIESESLLSVTLVNNTLVTLSSFEDVTFTMLTLESNIFAETEDYALPLACQLLDTLTQQEDTLTVAAQNAVDSVAIIEQNIATNDIFDGNDFNLSDEEIFEQVYEYNTDSTVSVDSLVVIETYIHFLSDQPIIASDAVLFIDNYTPVDTVLLDDDGNEVFALNLADAPAEVSEVIVDLQANTFTGWVDLLSNNEYVAYNVNEDDEETQTELEGVFYFENAVYQDYSTPLTEINSLVVNQSSTDSGQLSEVSAVSVTLPVSEQLDQADTSTTTSINLESNSLSITDTFAMTLSYNVSVSLIQVDASTVTSNINEAVTLLLAESNNVTGDALESDDTPINDTPQNVTGVLLPGVTLSITDTSFFVTVSVPLDVTPIDETVTFSIIESNSIVTLSLADVSSTTSINLEVAALQNDETVTYTTVLAPIERTPVVEAPLAIEDSELRDTALSEQEVLAVGYTLLDTSLNIVETITIIRQSYIKVYGVIRTGQADGIIRSGIATGVIRTGLADGVIS